MNFKFADFLSFNRMITPLFITILYYVLMVLSILGSLVGMIRGADMPFGGGQIVFFSLVSLIVSPFMIRLFCELLIVIFKIHDRLVSLDDKQNSANKDF